MSQEQLPKLLRVLDERDIPLTKDDVQWAFENSQTRDAATQWVHEYLSDKTLLTKDELSFTEREHHASYPAPSHLGRPLSDLEVEAALQSLKQSTAAIDTQCDLLESQTRALREIRARNTGNGLDTTPADPRQKRFVRQKAQLDLDIEELSHELGDNIRSSSKQAEAVTIGVPSQLERLLERDDRLFDGLQKLLPKLSDSSGPGVATVEVERLCSALSALSQKEIRTRLNLIYRRGLVTHSERLDHTPSKKLSTAQLKQRDTLRAELHELSSEIEGLVGIVVDHHHRKPLKTGVTSALEDSHAQKAKWSEYAVSILMYLAARLDALHDHVQHLHAHRSALASVADILDETLAAQNGKRSPANSLNVAERPAPKGLKPLRLVQANLSETQDPALQLLRQLDLRASENDGDTKLSKMLDSAVRERMQKSSHLARTTDEGIVEAVSQSLSQAELNTQDILHAVYTHSKFRKTRLVDDQLQANIDGLEGRTQHLGDEMRKFDLDTIMKSIRSRQADMLQEMNL